LFSGWGPDALMRDFGENAHVYCVVQGCFSWCLLARRRLDSIRKWPSRGNQLEGLDVDGPRRVKIRLLSFPFLGHEVEIHLR
jgi:hypothetical protein